MLYQQTDSDTPPNQTHSSDSPQGNEGDHSPLCLSFDVPPALSNITHLRRTARCLLESMGFSREDTDDVETLIGELSTNVVRHAQTDNGNYQVSLEFQEKCVIVTVVDQGAGFIEDAILPPGTVRPDTLLDDADDRFGGLGLPLIYALADHVEITPTEPHGTTVRAEKTIR
jgi:anti-sigma regulatory factor (Ser/Thr protein kinase)